MKIHHVLITTLLLLVFTLGLSCKNDIKNIFEPKPTVFQVKEVVENPKKFEKFEKFLVKGIANNTTSLLGFKGYSLIDSLTQQKIYILPRGLSLPIEGASLEVAVEFYDQYKLLEASFILLKEVE